MNTSLSGRYLAARLFWRKKATFAEVAFLFYALEEEARGGYSLPVLKLISLPGKGCTLQSEMVLVDEKMETVLGYCLLTRCFFSSKSTQALNLVLAVMKDIERLQVLGWDGNEYIRNPLYSAKATAFKKAANCPKDYFEDSVLLADCDLAVLASVVGDKTLVEYQSRTRSLLRTLYRLGMTRDFFDKAFECQQYVEQLLGGLSAEHGVQFDCMRHRALEDYQTVEHSFSMELFSAVYLALGGIFSEHDIRAKYWAFAEVCKKDQQLPPLMRDRKQVEKCRNEFLQIRGSGTVYRALLVYSKKFAIKENLQNFNFDPFSLESLVSILFRGGRFDVQGLNKKDRQFLFSLIELSGQRDSDKFLSYVVNHLRDVGKLSKQIQNFNIVEHVDPHQIRRSAVRDEKKEVEDDSNKKSASQDTSIGVLSEMTAAVKQGESNLRNKKKEDKIGKQEVPPGVQRKKAGGTKSKPKGLVKSCMETVVSIESTEWEIDAEPVKKVSSEYQHNVPESTANSKKIHTGGESVAKLQEIHQKEPRPSDRKKLKPAKSSLQNSDPTTLKTSKAQAGNKKKLESKKCGKPGALIPAQEIVSKSKKATSSSKEETKKQAKKKGKTKKKKNVLKAKANSELPALTSSNNLEGIWECNDGSGSPHIKDIKHVCNPAGKVVSTQMRFVFHGVAARIFKDGEVLLDINGCLSEYRKLFNAWSSGSFRHTKFSCIYHTLKWGTHLGLKQYLSKAKCLARSSHLPLIYRADNTRIREANGERVILTADGKILTYYQKRIQPWYLLVRKHDKEPIKL